MLIGVAILLVAIAILIYPLVDWSALFGASTPETAAEVGPAAAVLIGLYLIGLPLGMSERVRLGFQEGFINSIFAMIGTIASIGGLVLAILLQASLPWLVVAVVLPPVAALAANTVKLFLRDRPWLAPRWNLASRAMVVRLAHVGFLFFALQVAVVVAFQSDVLVAAAVLGPDAAATYAVTLRMFMLVPSLVGLVLLALWPAYTEAIARGDISWVRHTLRRSVIAASAASLASSALLVVAGPALIGLLTGDRIHPPFALLIGAAIWAVVNATFNAVTVLFNAASIITFQVDHCLCDGMRKHRPVDCARQHGRPPRCRVGHIDRIYHAVGNSHHALSPACDATARRRQDRSASRCVTSAEAHLGPTRLASSVGSAQRRWPSCRAGSAGYRGIGLAYSGARSAFGPFSPESSSRRRPRPDSRQLGPLLGVRLCRSPSPRFPRAGAGR